MSLPGFTAEASLYVTHEKYRLLKIDSASANHAHIIPQLSTSYIQGCCNGGMAAQITKWIGDYAGWCHIDFYYGYPCSGGIYQCSSWQATSGCQRWY